jgi:hypothetical protein
MPCVDHREVPETSIDATIVKAHVLPWAMFSSARERAEESGIAGQRMSCRHPEVWVELERGCEEGREMLAFLIVHVSASPPALMSSHSPPATPAKRDAEARAAGQPSDCTTTGTSSAPRPPTALPPVLSTPHAAEAR